MLPTIFYVHLLSFFVLNNAQGDEKKPDLNVRNFSKLVSLNLKTVRTDFVLHRIEKLDESKQELEIEITWQLHWVDTNLTTRLQDTHNAADMKTNTLGIELPDVFLDNEKQRREMHSLTLNTASRLQIQDSGLVCYRVRSTVLLSCPLDLKFYPFDRIVCSIEVAAYSDANVNLTWSNKSLIISENLKHPAILSFKEFSNRDKKYTVTSQGNISIITMNLILKREYHFYLTTFYVPVLLILLISWLPFWLRRVLMLRIYIALSTVIFLSWYYVSRPIVLNIAYLTSLDAWRAINFVFILLAAFESVFIAYMIKTNRTRMRRIHPDDNEKFKMLACKFCPLKKKYLEADDIKNTDLDLEILKLQANYKVEFVNVAKEVEIIDSVSKLFFPSAYCIFLFFYCFKCYANLYL